MLENYQNLPEMETIEENPLNYDYISEMPQGDENLLTMQQKI